MSRPLTQLEDQDALVEAIFTRALRQELKTMADNGTPAPGAPIKTAIKAQLQDLADKAGMEGAHDVRLAALQELSERPGWKTTEFYVSLIASTIGGVLVCIPGKEFVGAIVLSIGTLSYNLSRGIAKKGQ